MMLGVANVCRTMNCSLGREERRPGAVTKDPSRRGLLAGSLGIGAVRSGGPGRSLHASGRRGERAKAAGETVAELMSAPPITIGPGASVADAARLSVFTRPGSQIRGDVLQQVIVGKLALDSAAFGVTVTSGVVTVTGQVESQPSPLT
jgi:hypothetical protein